MLEEPTMPTRPKPRARVGAAAVIEEHRAADADERLVLHPDGWYWVSPDRHQQFGPFVSADEARADRDRDEDPAPGLELAEAEDAIGMHNWIDPETGEPAEGASRPHLDSA
jgi:hypothetical protein